MTVSSQESLKTLLDKIPECKLNGENLNCRFATHHNLSVFEDVAKLRKSTTFFFLNFTINVSYIEFQFIKNCLFLL